MKDKKILAVETCTSACSVALWDGAQLHETQVQAARSHSQLLLPMCQTLLKEAGLTMSMLDGIACTQGPGSFTGLRIGVGVAKGLAFGQDLPIYAVSSLMALAQQVIAHDNIAENAQIIALLDARMGELYAGTYQNQGGIAQRIGKEKLTTVDALTVANQCVAGTGAEAYHAELTQKGAKLSSVLSPSAREVIALVHAGQATETTATALVPVYLRNKVVG